MAKPMRYDVCHLTVLNPALHSRIFYKEARTLQEAGYNACIVGQDEAAAPYEHMGIAIQPLPVAGRGLCSRAYLHLRILFLLFFRIRARVYHLHAPELIPIGFALKLLGAQLVYDVHEDYYLNIRYGGTTAKPWHKPLADVARWMERMAARRFDYIFYAEACYHNMLAAPTGKCAVLPNYFYLPPFAERLYAPLPHMPVLGYFGTIARNWGIVETIDLWRQLNKTTPVFLLVGGHTYDAQLLAQLQQQLHQSNLAGRWRLLGGKNYLAYEELIDHMQACTFIAALYHPTANIRDRIPTKFYEAIALGKPVVFTHNPTWDELNDQNHFGLGIDLDNLSNEAARIARALQYNFADCYQYKIPFEAFAWEAVQHRLLEAYAMLLKR